MHVTRSIVHVECRSASAPNDGSGGWRSGDPDLALPRPPPSRSGSCRTSIRTRRRISPPSRPLPPARRGARWSGRLKGSVPRNRDVAPHMNGKAVKCGPASLPPMGAVASTCSSAQMEGSASKSSAPEDMGGWTPVGGPALRCSTATGSCHTRDRDRDVARSGSSSSGRPELLVQQGAEGDWLTNGGRVGGTQSQHHRRSRQGLRSRDTPLCCDGQRVRISRADLARGVPFRAACEAVSPVHHRDSSRVLPHGLTLQIRRFDMVLTKQEEKRLPATLARFPNQA